MLAFWRAPLLTSRSLNANMLGVDGAQIMADLLKTNTTITALRCATARAMPTVNSR